jgi:hypothetical protein
MKNSYIVGSLNVARALSDENRYLQVVEGIEQMDVDVLTISEAFDKDCNMADPDFADRLGYDMVKVEYEDNVPHPSVRQYITMLTRKELGLVPEPIRLGTRNALQVHLPVAQSKTKN